MMTTAPFLLSLLHTPTTCPSITRIGLNTPLLKLPVCRGSVKDGVAAGVTRNTVEGEAGGQSGRGGEAGIFCHPMGLARQWLLEARLNQPNPRRLGGGQARPPGEVRQVAGRGWQNSARKLRQDQPPRLPCAFVQQHKVCCLPCFPKQINLRAQRAQDMVSIGLSGRPACSKANISLRE
jgi:hypothetical protein